MIDLTGPGAGDLRHRIRFDRRPDTYPTPGPAGDPLDEWQPVRSCWASIEPLSGREQVVAAQTQATTTHRIEIRAVVRVDPSWRVVFRGRVFGIDSVADAGEVGAFLTLYYTEREGDVA